LRTEAGLLELYHREIGLPDFAKQLDGTKHTLKLSKHAEQAQYQDRYGAFEIPDVLYVRLPDVFEIGVEGKQIVKVAVRRKYDDRYDISIVFNKDSGVVRTAWLNERTDRHSTLDASKYCRP